MPLDLGADYVEGQTATAEIFNDKFNAIEAWANGDIDLGDLGSLIAERLVPVGTILATGRTTAPSGYVLCLGTSFSTSGTYAALFAAIGYTYGGSGGNFNVPDMRGRVPTGADSAGVRMPVADSFGVADLGDAGGSEVVTLSTSQIPAHSHHLTLQSKTVITSVDSTGSGVGNYTINGWQTNPQFDTDNTGGGGSHSNTQPYQMVNYMIKA